MGGTAEKYSQESGLVFFSPSFGLKITEETGLAVPLSKMAPSPYSPGLTGMLVRVSRRTKDTSCWRQSFPVLYFKILNLILGWVNSFRKNLPCVPKYTVLSDEFL